MVDATHLYLVLRGGYTFTSPETWQVGIRWQLEHNTSTPDEVGTLKTFGVSPEVISRTESDWTIVGDYSCDLGLATVFRPDDWLNDQVGNELRNVVFPHASNKVQLRELHVWPIAADGSVVDGRTCVLTFTGSLPGGSNSGNPLPLENSMVVSFSTGRIGRHGRGRVYWPTQPTSDIDATGLFGATPQGDLADTFAEFLTDVAITGTIITDVWCLPVVTGKPYVNYALITGLNVGNVVDTQRRRRRQEVESRTTRTLSY